VARRFWLLKSDPDTFGLEHLKAARGQTTMWDGVRNFQARNYLRDGLTVGDGVLFYHSQSKPPAVVALATVVRAGYPDPTQFDPTSPGHDPAASPERPRWFAVDVKLDRELPRPVTLPEIRATAGLGDMVLVRKGRLSVQPVTAAEWRIVNRLGGVAPHGRPER
jgi:predicted RNA-binding protein with PUA-like domain